MQVNKKTPEMVNAEGNRDSIVMSRRAGVDGCEK
jgi:hypothetical protein